MSWRSFLNKTKKLPPSPLLREALSHAVKPSVALDLGCGSGRDARYLLEQGLLVTAVDINPEVGQFLAELPNQDRLSVVYSSFDDFKYRSYDVINARYALPFNPPSSFNQVLEKILTSLNLSGIFVGQFFGPKDSWNNGDGKMSFHTRTDIEKLFAQLLIVKLEEIDEDGTASDGQIKHWHVFDVIAQKV